MLMRYEIGEAMRLSFKCACKHRCPQCYFVDQEARDIHHRWWHTLCFGTRKIEQGLHAQCGDIGLCTNSRRDHCTIVPHFPVFDAEKRCDTDK